jgi:hypothetical protein
VTVLVHGRKRYVTRQRCTTRVITGTATFTTTGATATLLRGQAVYATGRAWLGEVTLHARRPINAGRYTLVLTRRVGHRWVVTRRVVRLR